MEIVYCEMWVCEKDGNWRDLPLEVVFVKV